MTGLRADRQETMQNERRWRWAQNTAEGSAQPSKAVVFLIFVRENDALKKS
jgi:hypothetical protein